MLALVRVWLSDDNTLLRDKMWRRLDVRLAPVLARIVEQGAAEGAFLVSSPAATARVMVALLHGLNDMAVLLFLERDEAGVTLADAEDLALAYTDALERILGTPAGTLHLGDKGALKQWYG
jgi:kynureninase